MCNLPFTITIVGLSITTIVITTYMQFDSEARHETVRHFYRLGTLLRIMMIMCYTEYNLTSKKLTNTDLNSCAVKIESD